MSRWDSLLAIYVKKKYLISYVNLLHYDFPSQFVETHTKKIKLFNEINIATLILIDATALPQASGYNFSPISP